MNEADIVELSDHDLIAAYERTTGECADAEALLAEIKRRGLNI